MNSYSTENVPVARRLDFWSSWASDRMTPMRVESGRRSVPFRGEMTSLEIGDVVVSRASSTPAIIHRIGHLPSRWAGHNFVISMPVENTMNLTTPTYERHVRAGELLITDSTHPGLVTHSGCTVITLRIAERLFRQHLPAGENLAGLVLDGNSGAGMLAASLMRSIWPKQPASFFSGSCGHLSMALIHAVAAACAEVSGARMSVSTTAAGRRQAVIRFIEERLSDAGLTIDSIAREFGVSSRTLRAMFSTSSEPLSAYIRRRRLEEAARQLRDPLRHCQSISDIAFNSGFNSLGTFDRAFKTHYSLTPGAYRALHTAH